MKLFTKEQEEKLLANGRLTKTASEKGDTLPDHVPVVKLFTLDSGGTWLISEINPDFPDIAYGLCDLGVGFPELGTVSIKELKALRGYLGLPVERDLHTTLDKPLSWYLSEAEKDGYIVT